MGGGKAEVVGLQAGRRGVLPEGEDVDGVDLRGSINQGLWQNLEGKIVLGDPLLPDAVGQLMPRIVVVGSSEL